MLTTLSERRVLQHPLYHVVSSVAEGPPPDLWTPAVISTALWLDAANESTFTKDGSQVITAWRGVKLPLKELIWNAGQKPIYTPNALNGKGALTNVDANTDFGMAGINIKYLAILAKWSSWFDYSHLCGSTYFHGGTGNLLFDSRYAGIGANQNPSCTQNGSSLPFTSMTRQTTPTIWTVYQSLFSSIFNSTLFSQGYSRAFRGDYYEVILIDTEVSIDIRQKLEGYLAHKWGLTANLPADHPYKNTPPTI